MRRYRLRHMAVKRSLLVVLAASLFGACVADMPVPDSSPTPAGSPAPRAASPTPVSPTPSATSTPPLTPPGADPTQSPPPEATPTAVPASPSVEPSASSSATAGSEALARTWVTVQSGDTFSAIARRYGLTVEILLAANPQIADPNIIAVGDRISIPNEQFTGDEVAIVDTLGAATPETTFGRPGSWGADISDQQNVGPLFSLDRPTLITEIGAFLYELPVSTDGPWLQVDIRPAVGDAGDLVPDVAETLAAFEVRRPSTRETISYVSVVPNVALPAGDYFAIFRPQPGGFAGLLGGASLPFEYRAGSTTVWVSSSSGRSTAQFVAVRILGRSLG